MAVVAIDPGATPGVVSEGCKTKGLLAWWPGGWAGNNALLDLEWSGCTGLSFGFKLKLLCCRVLRCSGWRVLLGTGGVTDFRQRFLAERRISEDHWFIEPRSIRVCCSELIQRLIQCLVSGLECPGVNLPEHGGALDSVGSPDGWLVVESLCDAGPHAIVQLERPVMEEVRILSAFAVAAKLLGGECDGDSPRGILQKGDAFGIGTCNGAIREDAEEGGAICRGSNNAMMVRDHCRAHAFGVDSTDLAAGFVHHALYVTQSHGLSHSRGLISSVSPMWEKMSSKELDSHGLADGFEVSNDIRRELGL